MEAEGLEELRPLFAVQEGDLTLDLRRDHDRLGVVSSGALRHLARESVAARCRSFVDIADIERRLGGQQLKHPPALLIAGGNRSGPRWPTLTQLGQGEIHQTQSGGALLVPGLGPLFEVHDPLLQALQVGEHQFGLDDVEVGDRVNPPLDVGDVVVDEAARNEGDGVAIPDVGQELVSQALALSRAPDQTRDVDEVDAGGNDLPGPGDLRQGVETRLRHRHVADIGFDGAEGIVGRLRRRRLGQGVEQGRLADIGQADNGDFQGHDAVNSLEPEARRLARARELVTPDRRACGDPASRLAPGA